MNKDFPMTEEITALLGAGFEQAARLRLAQLTAQWEARAATGTIMNLSDLIASHEAFIVAPRKKS